MHRRLPHPAPARRATPAQRPPVPLTDVSDAPALALSMQRLVGNKRSEALLQRQASAAPHAPGATAAAAIWDGVQTRHRPHLLGGTVVFDILTPFLTQVYLNGVEFRSGDQLIEALQLALRVDPLPDGTFRGSFAPVTVRGSCVITVPPPASWTPVSVSGAVAVRQLYNLPARVRQQVARLPQVTVRVPDGDANALHQWAVNAEMEHAQDAERLFTTHIGALIGRLNANLATTISGDSVEHVHTRLNQILRLSPTAYDYIAARNAATRSHDSHNHGSLGVQSDGTGGRFDARTGVLTVPVKPLARP